MSIRIRRPIFDVPATAATLIATLMESIHDSQNPIIWCFSNLTEVKMKWKQLLEERVLDQEMISHDKSPHAKPHDVYGLRIKGCDIYMQRESQSCNINVYNNGSLSPEMYEFVTTQSYETILGAMKSTPGCRRSKVKVSRVMLTIKGKEN
jgi:hypothetical protein